MSLSEQDWQLRANIYKRWIDNGVAPELSDLATNFGLSIDEIQSSLERLNSAHQLFLDPQTHNIRMANPLSALPTDYRVKVGKHWVYANCAWDTLGIVAMIKQDAIIDAQLPLSKEPVIYQVTSGKLVADDGLLVHFSLPVNEWYDDLIHT